MTHAMASPTALLEGDAAQASRPDPGAPAPDRADEARRQQGRLILFAAFTTTIALLFRYGYSFGLFDQTVYSLRGIALADPNAFRHDWFARTVPQPHWLFDAVTYAGARLGVLPAVYLAYWLAGIVAFAVGAVWLTRRFLPDRPALAAVLGPLLVLGPEKILGSTTPLLWFADPHMLGGCLAFLALVALLTDRWNVAVVASLLAGAFHIQHGANLAPVLLLTAVLAQRVVARRRVMLAATAMVLVGGAQAVAVWRGIDTSGDAWLTICRDLIPFHCYAPGWSWTYLAVGGAILALAFGFGWWQRAAWRTILPVAVLPAAGLLVGVIGERFQLGVLGRLAAQYNVHRLATVVVPFAAFAVICLVTRAVAGDRRWIFGGAAIPFIRRALVVSVVIVLPIAALNGSLGRIGYDRDLPTVKVGEAIRRAVPPDGIIAAPPDIVWLRSLSARSVVADCKAVPFGGRPWEEYVARMRDLGGHCQGGPSRWKQLSPEAVESLRARYGVTHVLLETDDPKVTYALAHWRQVFEAPPNDFAPFAGGLVVFDTRVGPR